MSRSADAAPGGVAVFDLDGTLTWRDTLPPFLGGYALRRPRKLLGLWRAPLALALYLLGGRDRGALKSRLIRMTMEGERRAQIERWADEYVRALQRRSAFRAGALGCLRAHREAGDRLVLLSASPDLYAPRIGAALGFDETISTGVRWRGDLLDGRLATANRRGEEKRRCLAELRARFPSARITAYGNAASDLPHLRAADRGVLVNASTAARRAARAQGIEVADWR